MSDSDEQRPVETVKSGRSPLFRLFIEGLAIVAAAGGAFVAGYRFAPQPSCREELREVTRLGLEASTAELVTEENAYGTMETRLKLSEANEHQLKLARRLPDLDSLEVFGTSYKADPVALDEQLADTVRSSHPDRLHLTSVLWPLPRTYDAIANSSLRGLSLWMVESKRLPQLPSSLHELKLGGGVMDDHNVAAIAECDFLERLNIVGAEFTPQGLDQWGRLKRLQNLAIINSLPRKAISTDSMRFVGQLSDLCSIAIDSRAIDDRFVDTILPLPYLNNIALSGTSVTDVGVQRILAGRQLAGLAINGRSVTDAGLEALKDQKRLTSLRLNSPSLTNDTARLICDLAELTELDLSQTQIDATGLADISRLSKLKSIALNGLTVSDSLLKTLSELPNLQSADLVESDGYSAVGLESIAACKTLKSLRLSSATVGDDALIQRLRDTHPALELKAY